MRNLSKGFVGITILILLGILLLGASAHKFYSDTYVSTPAVVETAMSSSAKRQNLTTTAQGNNSSIPMDMEALEKIEAETQAFLRGEKSNVSWKLYTNPDLGFQVKVPSTWESNAEGTWVSFTYGRPNDAPKGGHVGVNANSDNDTLAGLMMKAKSVPHYTSFKNLVIGGEPAFIYQSGEFASTLGIVIHNNRVYRLDNELVTNPDILSSFAFTK